jgi:hypothetical protein
MASNELNKSQGNSRIVVMTNWQYTEEMSLAFTRLMTLLLQENFDRKLSLPKPLPGMPAETQVIPEEP